MMTVRSLLLAAALLAATGTTAFAQSSDDAIAAPVLRASITVSSDVVRIGDVIDNAGSSALIAIYRAPDLGTTGSLPTEKVIAALQAHQVIGVDTKDIKAISVTRLSRRCRPRNRTAGRPRAGTSQRPRRCRQPDPDLRSRRAGSCSSKPPTPARCSRSRPGTTRAAAASMSASKSPTRPARRRPDCALPASRSRPWKPRS